MPSQAYPFKSLSEGGYIYATVHWPEGKQDGPYGIGTYLFFQMTPSNSNMLVALAFHGGGFVVGSRDMLPQEQIQYLTDSGFVVVSADYRLCPQVSLYDGPIQDAKDAYTWCKQHLPALVKEGAEIEVDPSQTVVFGHSAGGLLALHTVR